MEDLNFTQQLTQTELSNINGGSLSIISPNMVSMAPCFWATDFIEGFKQGFGK
ncbi:MAG: hypothetical protein ACRC7R_06865 [Sarcina sp.]